MQLELPKVGPCKQSHWVRNQLWVRIPTTSWTVKSTSHPKGCLAGNFAHFPASIDCYFPRRQALKIGSFLISLFSQHSFLMPGGLTRQCTPSLLMTSLLPEQGCLDRMNVCINCLWMLWWNTKGKGKGRKRGVHDGRAEAWWHVASSMVGMDSPELILLKCTITAERELELMSGFKLSKPTCTDTLPLTRLHLNISQQSHQLGNQVFKCLRLWESFSFKHYTVHMSNQL